MGATAEGNMAPQLAARTVNKRRKLNLRGPLFHVPQVRRRAGLFQRFNAGGQFSNLPGLFQCLHAGG